MKAVINCDEVFDVLTRGPFPSGATEDGFVEMHLRVCHECRQLAEALRPAVGLFHESLPAESDALLPRYGGSLDEAIQPKTEKTEIDLVAITSLASPERRGPIRVTAGTIAVSMTGLLAVVLLFVGSLASRVAIVQNVQNGQANSSRLTLADSVAGERAHATLTSLRIPLSCLPDQGEQIDLSRVRSANLLLTPSQRADFACCTRCHFSGGRSIRSQPAMQKVMFACAHCHHTPTSEQSAFFRLPAKPYFV